MVVNVGYIAQSLQNPADPDGPLVEYRVYYDETALPVGPTQPIVNKTGALTGANCAFEVNSTGPRFKVEVWRPELGPVDDPANWETVKVPTGPTTLTRQQLAQWGIATRGDVAVRLIRES